MYLLLCSVRNVNVYIRRAHTVDDVLFVLHKVNLYLLGKVNNVNALHIISIVVKIY
jgi:hypothetical protein